MLNITFNILFNIFIVKFTSNRFQFVIDLSVILNKPIIFIILLCSIFSISVSVDAGFSGLGAGTELNIGIELELYNCSLDILW